VESHVSRKSTSNKVANVKVQPKIVQLSVGQRRYLEGMVLHETDRESVPGLSLDNWTGPKTADPLIPDRTIDTGLRMSLPVAGQMVFCSPITFVCLLPMTARTMKHSSSQHCLLLQLAVAMIMMSALIVVPITALQQIQMPFKFSGRNTLVTKSYVIRNGLLEPNSVFGFASLSCS
jgi:hypothetical protein